MKAIPLSPYIFALCFTYFNGICQSGAVIQGGLLFRDFERDAQSVLSQSAPGFFAGIEVRLAAEERTYFKPAAYISRIQGASQNHFQETRVFKIQSGYDILTGALGLETRVVDAGSVHWRMAFSGYADYVVNVRGDTKFEDLSSVVLGLMVSTGLDLGSLAADVKVRRALSDLVANQMSSHYVQLSLSIGLFF